MAYPIRDVHKMNLWTRNIFLIFLSVCLFGSVQANAESRATLFENQEVLKSGNELGFSSHAYNRPGPIPRAHIPNTEYQPVPRFSPVANLHQLMKRVKLAPETGDSNPLDSVYPAYEIDMPISHFPTGAHYTPHVNGTFPTRFWFDPTYYKPGGPVILMLSGETSGKDRLEFMRSGILRQMAEGAEGLAVILEHRYYGASLPFGNQSLVTENLRFLTTDQALADADWFARNIDFPGLTENLRASDAAWIVYGGSYAGGMAAFLRTQYPETFWGGISSSGVTVAVADFWKYTEPIRKYGPAKCVSFTQDLIQLMDYYLLPLGNSNGNHHKRGNTNTQKKRITAIQKLFGLQNITDPADFGNTMFYVGPGYWQAINWDPLVTYNIFDNYCANLTAPTIQYPNMPAKIVKNAKDMVKKAGLKSSSLTPILNMIGYVNETQVKPCASSNLSQDQCFGFTNATFFQQDDISQGWRQWGYQFCDQWGYFQTGATIPQNIRPVISRSTDIHFASTVCREAFGINRMPDVNAINSKGGYGIAYDRLGWVDGEVDVWRPVSPHADGQPGRVSTVNRPWILIAGGGHHWDENGRLANETTPLLPPPAVVSAQQQILVSVKQWHADWVALHP